MKEIKQLTKEHYDAVIALDTFAFQFETPSGDEQAQRLKREQELDREVIFGWMDDDNIAAKVHVIPFNCYINGNAFKMGGIAAVATFPEYRRQGMVRHLLKHALQSMREKGQTVSILYPFSYGFYRKFGWELANMGKQYTIPMNRLKQDWDATGYLRPCKKDISLLDTIYTSYAQHYNGMLKRDTRYWETSILKDDKRVAIAYNHDDVPEGYIIYHVKRNTLTVDEYAYTSLNGWKLILQFIANHDSMADKVHITVPETDNLTLLLAEPFFEQKMHPSFMARIVDVFQFLKAYTFTKTDQPLSTDIYVEDRFMPENSGTYTIQQTGDTTHVTVSQDTPPAHIIHCQVEYLAQMLLGFKRPTELYEHGFISGDRQAIDQLETRIPYKKTLLWDGF